MATELPEKPLSRKESYLAAIAGESVELPEAPESRTEQYLAYIAENGGGGGGGTNNFNQLTNRPKYNSTTMTGSTNIPKVPTKTSELSNDSGFVTSGSLATVATTGAYSDLSGTPTIPTVNDATLTITQNGVSAGTFTANDADDATIALTDTTYSAFTGTDGTAAGTAGLVPAPTTSDTDKYLKSDGSWATVSGGGGTTYTAGDGIDITNAVISATNTGKAKVLTTDDYNWPENNPASVALWLLEDGVYSFDNLAVQYNSNVSFTDTGMVIVNKATVSSGMGDGVVLYMPTGNSAKLTRQIRTNGSGGITSTIGPTIANNLTTVITGYVLDASQGKVLKDLVDSLAIRASGAPTTSTVGAVGTLYEDTTNGKLYICTAVSGSTYTWAEVGAGGGSTGITVLSTSDYNYPTDSPTKVALWLLPKGVYYKPSDVSVGITTANVVGGQGVLTVGDINPQGYKTVMYIHDELTSPVQVMQISSTGSISGYNSANLAKLSDIYADPATQYKIKIGAGTSSSEGNNAVEIGHNAAGTGLQSIALGFGASASQSSAIGIGSSAQATTQHGIAIGYQASTGGKYCVALGANSATPTGVDGVVSIGGTNLQQQGYNSSNYRLLTGLYDPQSAHDAATKGYVDPTTDSSAPTTATVGRLGQIFIDTTNAAAYMCVAVDSVTPSYTWKQITV